jgi:hypothetical protein
MFHEKVHRRAAVCRKKMQIGDGEDKASQRVLSAAAVWTKSVQRVEK